jgi:hypothetical protein
MEPQLTAGSLREAGKNQAGTARTLPRVSIEAASRTH